MGKFYSQKVFSKEDCKIVENLTKEEIQNLGKEERVFFKCSQCGKEVIQRASCFKKSFLELCRPCKMEKRLGYRNNFNAPDFLEKKGERPLRKNMVHMKTVTRPAEKKLKKQT